MGSSISKLNYDSQLQHEETVVAEDQVPFTPLPEYANVESEESTSFNNILQDKQPDDLAVYVSSNCDNEEIASVVSVSFTESQTEDSIGDDFTELSNVKTIWEDLHPQTGNLTKRNYEKSLTLSNNIQHPPNTQTSYQRQQTLCHKYPHIYGKARETLQPFFTTDEREIKSNIPAPVSTPEFQHSLREVPSLHKNDFLGKCLQNRLAGNSECQAVRNDVECFSNRPAGSKENIWKTTRLGTAAWIHHPSKDSFVHMEFIKQYNKKRPLIKSCDNNRKLFTSLPMDLSNNASQSVLASGDGTNVCSRQKEPRNLSKRGYMDIICNRQSLTPKTACNTKKPVASKSPLLPPIKRVSCVENCQPKLTGIHSIYHRNVLHQRSKLPSEALASSIYSRSRPSPKIVHKNKRPKQEDCLNELSRLTLAEINYPWDRQRIVLRESRSDGDAELYKQTCK